MPHPDNGRAFTLDNGLRVLIINQPLISYSYVSLTVRVGALYDTIDGIAHLTEHMLFAGTDKYPQREEIYDYLKQRGGWADAYTEFYHTCYSLEVNSRYLFESLDRLSHFFIDPLLNQKDIESEVKTIESEYDMRIKDDRFVMHNISWDELDRKPRLPAGSRKTLQRDDVSEKLVEFFETYYVANNMTLIIITPPLDNLEDTIREYFSPIKSNSSRIEAPDNFTVPKLIKFVPKDTNHMAMIFWDIPYFDHTQNPCAFLQYLVHTEMHINFGDLAYQYYFDVTNEKNKINLKLELSDQGIEQFEKIMGIFYSYFHLLTQKLDTLERLYDNFRQAGSFENELLEHPRTLGQRLRLLVGFYDIPIDELTRVGYALTSDFQTIKRNITQILDCLKPGKATVVLASPTFKNLTHKHVYYDCKYSIENRTIEPMMIDYDFKIKNNPYFEQDKSIEPMRMDKPKLLADNDRIAAYYHSNTYKYPTPNATIIQTIRFHNVTNAYEDMCVYVYFEYVKKFYENWMAIVSNAGYEFNLEYCAGVLSLEISGNHKQLLGIYRKILKKINNIARIDKVIFERVKSYVVELADSFDTLNISTKFRYYRNRMECSKYYAYQDYRAIDELTPNKLVKCITGIIPTGMSKKIILFTSGNKCNREFCRACVDYVLEMIGGDGNPRRSRHQPFKVKPRKVKGQELVRFKNTNTREHSIGCIFPYQQLYRGDWVEDYLKLSILEHYLYTEFFEEMRTKRKIGYNIDTKIDFSVCGGETKCALVLYILSSTHSANNMMDRIEEFFANIRLDPAKFDNIVESVKFYYLEADSTPTLYTHFTFNSIIDAGYPTFNLVEDIIQTLDRLTAQEVLDYFDWLRHQPRRYLVIE